MLPSEALEIYDCYFGLPLLTNNTGVTNTNITKQYQTYNAKNKKLIKNFLLKLISYDPMIRQEEKY